MVGGRPAPAVVVASTTGEPQTQSAGGSVAGAAANLAAAGGTTAASLPGTTPSQSDSTNSSGTQGNGIGSGGSSSSGNTSETSSPSRYLSARQIDFFAELTAEILGAPGIRQPVQLYWPKLYVKCVPFKRELSRTYNNTTTFYRMNRLLPKT